MMTVVGGELSDRRGPSAVLGEVFRGHYSSLVGLARLLDRDDADELVQEAFVRVHVAWERLHDQDDPLPYLRQVVVNLARSGIRRKVLARRRPLTLAPPVRAAEDDALAGDDRRAVRAALDVLSVRQRECVVLRYFLDCSTEETAEALGVSEGTVKTHLHRGLAAMEKVLEVGR
jgi:RNA polymerase sigma-70 factor (sigma-E family)